MVTGAGATAGFCEVWTFLEAAVAAETTTSARIRKAFRLILI